MDNISSEQDRKVISEKADTGRFGKKKVNYKLRDWLFSRQRYWGEPIPLIHLDNEVVASLPRISDISEATDPTLAYVLKSQPIECINPSTLCSHGKVRELVIG